MARPPFDDDPVLELVARPLRDMAARAQHVPSRALHELLTTGHSIDKGELPVTAVSNVHGSALWQRAGLPKWRKTMLELLLAKLAGLSLVAKVGVGTAMAAAAVTGGTAVTQITVPDDTTVVETATELPDATRTEEVVEDVTESPATEAPATEAPATEAPGTEAPETEAPGTEMPETQDPTEAPAAGEAPEDADDEEGEGRGPNERANANAFEKAGNALDKWENGNGRGRDAAKDRGKSGEHRGRGKADADEIEGDGDVEPGDDVDEEESRDDAPATDHTGRVRSR